MNPPPLPSDSAAPASDPSTLPIMRTDGTAIASLLLGVIGYFGPGPLTWIAGIICGHIARKNIRESNGAITGDGIAVGGLITSYLGLSLLLLVILFCLATFLLFGTLFFWNSGTVTL